MEDFKLQLNNEQDKMQLTLRSEKLKIENQLN